MSADPVVNLFELSDAVRYLLGRPIDDSEFAECNACSCPVSVIYVERLGWLIARCGSCGEKVRSPFKVNEEWLPQLAAEVRWNTAIDEYEKQFLVGGGLTCGSARGVGNEDAVSD